MKNPLSIGAIISTISVQPLIAVATQATEQLNTFSLGYSQNTTDYFAENGSEILPTSLSFRSVDNSPKTLLYQLATISCQGVLVGPFISANGKSAKKQQR